MLWGREPRAAALCAHLVPVPAPLRADHPFGLRLVRRAGAGTHRQPRHPPAGRPGRYARPRRAPALRPHADGVLAQRQRRRHSGRVLGRGGAVADAGPQSPAAREPHSDLRALSLAALCWTDLHEFPVGHVPFGNDDRRARDEFRPDDRRLARALAPVPLHVHVGRREAHQRRSQLVESLGALLSFPDPAVADAARVVRRRASGEPVACRHGRRICCRARPAVPDLLPAPLTICLGVRHPHAAGLHPAHRQLQLVQPANHALVPAAHRRRGAAQDIATPPGQPPPDARKRPPPDGR